MQHYLRHPNNNNNNNTILCLIIRYNLLAVCLASILLMCQHAMIDIYLYICIRNASNSVWCWSFNALPAQPFHFARDIISFYSLSRSLALALSFAHFCTLCNKNRSSPCHDISKWKCINSDFVLLTSLSPYRRTVVHSRGSHVCTPLCIYMCVYINIE